MADNQRNGMDRIRRELFNFIADIALDAYQGDSTLTTEDLMMRLDAGMFFFPGNRKRIASQLVSAALGIATAVEDSYLAEAISSVFVDELGWPLIAGREGGRS